MVQDILDVFRELIGSFYVLYTLAALVGMAVIFLVLRAFGKRSQ
jgi:hypothetical protein